MGVGIGGVGCMLGSKVVDDYRKWPPNFGRERMPWLAVLESQALRQTAGLGLVDKLACPGIQRKG